jgi:hypothetical protein
MKTYKTLDTLPIYNHKQLIKTGDLRYLIYNSVEGDLPEINKDEQFELIKINNELLRSNNEFDLTLQNKYYNVLKTYLEYQNNATPKNEQKNNTSFATYLEYLNDNFKNFNAGEYSGDNIIEIYKTWKKKQTFDKEIYFNRIGFFSYHSLQMVPLMEYDFYKEISMIMNLLNVQINEFETSVNKYRALRDVASKKIEIANNNLIKK